MKLKRDVNLKFRMEKNQKMVLYVANRQDCNIESLGQWRLQELMFAKVINCLNSPLKWTSGNMLKKSCMDTSGELGQPLVIWDWHYIQLVSTSVQKVYGFWYVSCVIFGNSIFQKCIIAMWKCKGFQKISIQIKVNVYLFKITIWVKLKVNEEHLSNSPLYHKFRSG